MRHSPEAGWLFSFQDIKFPLDDIRATATFDELLLAFYTPRGVYVFRQYKESDV